MFVVPIQTYILIYKKIYEHWGVAGTLVRAVSHKAKVEKHLEVLTLKNIYKYVKPMRTSEKEKILTMTKT